MRGEKRGRDEVGGLASRDRAKAERERELLVRVSNRGALRKGGKTGLGSTSAEKCATTVGNARGAFHETKVRCKSNVSK